MTELESKLLALLKESEKGSIEREERLTKHLTDLEATVLSLQEQLKTLAPRLNSLASQQDKIADQYSALTRLLNEA